MEKNGKPIKRLGSAFPIDGGHLDFRYLLTEWIEN